MKVFNLTKKSFPRRSLSSNSKKNCLLSNNLKDNSKRLFNLSKQKNYIPSNSKINSTSTRNYSYTKPNSYQSTNYSSSNHHSTKFICQSSKINYNSSTNSKTFYSFKITTSLILTNQTDLKSFRSCITTTKQSFFSSQKSSFHSSHFHLNENEKKEDLSLKQGGKEEEKLKKKSALKIESPFDAAIKLGVFSVTGSATLFFVRPFMTSILGLEGSIVDGPWSYRIVSILLITPCYSVLLILIGALVGRYLFFKEFALKPWLRLYNLLNKNKE